MKAIDLVKIKNFLKDIIYVALVYLIFTIFFFQSFHIPSSSMEPTLEVGDRLMVNKFAIGHNRYSFYGDPEFISEGRLWGGSLERGEIAVFTLPYRNHTDFIKRVIGLPGDRIQVKSGRLYINGDLIDRKFIRDVAYKDYHGTQKRAKEYIETLPGGITHTIYEQSDSARMDDTPLYVVPEDHYFMMGDNRDESADSRELFNMGYVHRKYIMGNASITTFSFYDCDQGKPVACLGPIPYGRFLNWLN